MSDTRTPPPQDAALENGIRWAAYDYMPDANDDPFLRDSFTEHGGAIVHVDLGTLAGADEIAARRWTARDWLYVTSLSSLAGTVGNDDSNATSGGVAAATSPANALHALHAALGGITNIVADAHDLTYVATIEGLAELFYRFPSMKRVVVMDTWGGGSRNLSEDAGWPEDFGDLLYDSAALAVLAGREKYRLAVWRVDGHLPDELPGILTVAYGESREGACCMMPYPVYTHPFYMGHEITWAKFKSLLFARAGRLNGDFTPANVEMVLCSANLHHADSWDLVRRPDYREVREPSDEDE